ncbi:uncharacterized protein LOC113331348 [Papaver somniferum]|uniref:uncharacterized protein LOC113331348 n=1 Tax=Papaver somniferum TaxID=3469 RepID=UPI000E6FB4DE|nr:uncharacterized protein LOC113331348 [Papaver somniferum]
MESHGKNVPKPSEVAAEFWTSHNTLIPYHVAWKARNNVLERTNGSFDESFRLIPSLCEMIERTNPGSISTFTYGRNVVGLDGCHLKGKYGGCLLSATALDGQNGLVPLGIMVCRNEHMYANFKMHYKGSKLHTLFWNSARAYIPKHFQAHMDSMMSENVSACQYLMGEDPKSWEKPVCKLVLMYVQLVMGLFYKRRNACVGWDSGDLVPTAKKLLKKMFKKTGEYKQLRGFPCQYAVCALQQIRPNWVEYCARYYSVDNYRTTYAPYMVPLEGPEDWDEVYLKYLCVST